MPGVLLEKVSDGVTQRNFERLNAALESIMGDPLRYAKNRTGNTAAVAYLKQPIAETTALLQPSGVKLALPVPGTYAFEFVVFFQTVITTTGMGLSVVGPPQSMVRFGAAIHESATVFRNGVGEAYEATILGTGIAANSSTRHAVIDGIVTTTMPGDLGLSFRTEVAASAVTMMPGSFGMAWSFQ